MNHYPHHIGDFDKATRHLTRIERSIYRDLIELYYDTEKPLTLDRAALCRRIIARTNEEVTAVEQTLNEFFTETPTGWFHSRCEHELDTYRANASQRAQAGKASAEAKRLKKLQALNGTSTTVERPLNSVATDGNDASTNREPGTVNREPDKEGGFASSSDAGSAGPQEPAETTKTGGAEPPGEPPKKRAAYQVPPCPYGDIVDLYHDMLPTLAKTVSLNESRRAQLRQRWAEACEDGKFDQAGGLEFFANYFTIVQKSPFLMGRVNGQGRRPFLCSLEWLTNSTNFLKVIEGRYADEKESA